ncbi:hypothetical protein Rhopal_004346-T1 [Rhodotorula paludigena]|uniref:Uncharacterized protein n=1 Tax=Rhodotorula paludigena TaxID=86838 RepID=A0AAV5GFJ2_9BASI|nr:hypothetical protein Rhopal_004346-T1 [Rhodotorula paludigena]
MAQKKPTQPDENSQLLPSSAPPPYTESAEPSGSTTPRAAAPAAAPHSAFASTASPSRSSRPHPSGPTAFSALPPPPASLYAHERAMHQAHRRARKRFCAALCWGMLIWVAVSALVGGIIGEEVVRKSSAARRTWEEGRNRVGEWAGMRTAVDEANAGATNAVASEGST